MAEPDVAPIINNYKVIAIVGMSDTVGKPSHRVGAYLKQHGYQIVPINPTIDKVFGAKSYRSLLDIPEHVAKTIEVVDVFRKPEDVPPIIDQAIQLRQKYGRLAVVWMQLGIKNEQAADVARKAGLTVVMDKCIMAERRHLTEKPQETPD
jgi:predicted CoA-binding protein